MTIYFTKGAPQVSSLMLENWMPEILRISELSRRISDNRLELSEGYKVKYLSLAEIQSGNALSTAETDRWRHLIISGSKAYGEIELDASEEPVALYEGESNENLVSALNIADDLDGEYEACVLIASALHFSGLWLHNATEDWIIPYPPNATPLINFQKISATEVFTTLNSIANDIVEISMDNDPVGG